MKRNPKGIMAAALVLTALLSLSGSISLAQVSGGMNTKRPNRCQLVSANPPDFNPFQFVPKEVDFKKLNRSPKVSYVVHEDGSVSDVKILKGTRSAKVDAGLVKSIQAWKYKPRPGCTVDASMVVVLDIW